MKLDTCPEKMLVPADDGRGPDIGKGGNSGPSVDEPDGEVIAPSTRVTKPEYDEDELGIYEDTDDGDDLTDTELELERLRLEKKVREENEKVEREKAKAKEDELKTDTHVQNVTKGDNSLQTIRDTNKELRVVDSVPPREEISVASKPSVQTWSAPKKDVSSSGPVRSRLRPRAKTTSMARELAESRNASRLALESREAMFRRAMSLLSARCTSVRNDTGETLPFGYHVPKYFYVTQDKPVPMEPLKAWRGYNGNIYFEPIAINNVNDSSPNMTRAVTSIPKPTRAAVPRIPTTKPRTSVDKENTSRSDSRQTNKSSQASQLMSNRQMSILDKQAILSRYNDSLTEDLTWLEGQENTGSLAIRPKTYPEKTRKEKERDLLYNKERIKKGSVAHKLYIENKAKQKPKLTVSGGKFTPPTSMSPLLRTQTQYSLSNQRLTTNSPDPYHLNDSKLPPLDQIRATIKHMDNKSESTFPGGKPYNRSVTLTDEMKPYVKYSPDVVAKMAQQANAC